MALKQWHRTAEMARKGTKLAWNFDNHRENRKYNSKIWTATWLPPKYACETAGFTIQTKDKRNTPAPPPPNPQPPLRGSLPELRSHACVALIHDREATWWTNTPEDSPWKLTRKIHKAIASHHENHESFCIDLAKLASTTWPAYINFI